jgi:hypothetical protein
MHNESRLVIEVSLQRTSMCGFEEHDIASCERANEYLISFYSYSIIHFMSIYTLVALLRK